jgi:hypothetical protein
MVDGEVDARWKLEWAMIPFFILFFWMSKKYFIEKTQLRVNKACKQKSSSITKKRL